MNVSDSEVVASILEQIGYSHTNEMQESDLILLNTCSIREKAELTVRKKLESINAIKKNKKNLKVGVLGCMAERLKEKFLEEEKLVDIVVGPDAYRDLPNLIKQDPSACFIAFFFIWTFLNLLKPLPEGLDISLIFVTIKNPAIVELMQFFNF